ncbi:septum site-determining protein MinC [bacterium]|nr:septum site-determining protein MinC [bacterium]
MSKLIDGNIYLLDLSQSKSASDIVFDLSRFLDTEESSNKRICLKLGKVDLNQAQILSVKSLINSRESALVSLETLSKQTEAAALAIGLIINKTQDSSSEEIEVPEKEYIKAEDAPELVQQAEEQEGVVEEAETKTEEEADVSNELDVIFDDDKKMEKMINSLEANNVYSEKNGTIDIDIPESEYTKEDKEIDEFSTKYIKQTLRSGQLINCEGNLVIIGDCHSGCEINAGGDVTVWGTLNGIVHAGCYGNTKARVRALKLNPIQIRIAGLFSRKPDGGNVILVDKSNEYTPEEARIINNEIVVFKMND